MKKPNVAATTEAPTNGQPTKAIETLASITETVLQFRGDKVTISNIARVVNRASHLLRIGALDERLEVENGATIALAKKHSLMT
jgi:hypothetical protein